MENQAIATDRQIYLDVAKGIGILLVVMGHCTPDAANPAGISNVYHKYLHEIIYSFHMPLFFVIAGYFTYKKNNYSKYEVVKKRFKRLMIPYFFVGICYLPIKMLFNSFANKPYDINDLWKIFIGVNPDGELWFLYSLFMIVVVASFFDFCVNRRLMIIALLFVLFPVIPALGIITNYLFFFLLGTYMRQNKYQLYDFTRKQVSGMVAIFLLGNYLNIVYGVYMPIITALAGVFLTFILAKRIEIMNKRMLAVLSMLGVMSMDIYILSDILKIPFRIILYNKFHFYNIAFLVCFVAAVGLSVIISKKIIRKTNCLRKLVLGG